ncbi:MAG: hypothetical protein U0U66_12755 [Cytophagaceae bacterium]
MYEQLGFKFNGKYHFTRQQLAQHLNNIKTARDVSDMNVGDIIQLYENEIDNWSKVPQLLVFTYKAFLNVGMLLTESEKA